jgi:hypothetical protein
MSSSFFFISGFISHKEEKGSAEEIQYIEDKKKMQQSCLFPITGREGNPSLPGRRVWKEKSG